MVATIEEFKAAFQSSGSGAASAPVQTAKSAPEASAAVAKKLDAALKQLQAAVEKLEKAGASSTLFRPTLDDLTARYDAAKAEAGTLSDADLAARYQAILDETNAKNTQFTQDLKNWQTYVAEKKKAADAIARLEKHKGADKIGPEIQQAKDEFAAAEALTVVGLYPDAAEGMRTAVAECATATVKANLIKGGEPKTSDFQALMKLPGKSKGKNRLDELIDGLPDEMQQKVYTTAIEARFGVKVGVFETEYKTVYKTDEDGVSVGKPVQLEEWQYRKVDLKAPNRSMKRIYQMLTKVPAAHANKKLNPSLKRILHFTEDDGSAAYWGYNKTVYMNVSRGKGVGDKDLTAEISSGFKGTVDMFPDGRDENCLPKNTDVETTFFDWATLHEVGHSVDDLHSFMDGHLEQPDFGDWKHETIATIAAVAGDHFGCDKAYIEQKLDGKDVADDKLPAVFTADEAGKDLKQKVDDWCGNIRLGKRIWDDGGLAKECKIGERVYQQAYKSTWVSYNYNARSKGIHGYQFRADGEWFAELYAAYYSDKLKDDHPAVAFLKKIEEEDTAKAAKKK